MLLDKSGSLASRVAGMQSRDQNKNRQTAGKKRKAAFAQKDAKEQVHDEKL
ncbi:MAG: hypothetical protein Q9184_007229 [Pyrenodesmia sp. 2 TL-2023]